MKYIKTQILWAGLILLVLLPVFRGFSQEITITVDARKPGAPIQPTMWGLFFEDINFGADGGLYAELIKNRSFEFDSRLMGWESFGGVTVHEENPCFDRNPRYVRLSYTTELNTTGLENRGFSGIGLKAGEKYRFSLYGRSRGEAPVILLIQLVSRGNDILNTREITIEGKEWQKYEAELTATATDAQARLRILVKERGGCADLDHISLFPAKTWKNRPNGLREDLVQALADIRPGLFRFPGGCIVEGTTIDTRYQWKNTVGPVENRPLNINRWNYIFAHRRFPDYYQSLGLGFYEYFLLSEDIGAMPLPVLNCGMSCQFENSDDHQHCKVENLEPYIQDALDLVEFANGPGTTHWGKLRSDMGHPAPFNLKYIAIGNEQWGELYPERLKPFIDALRAKHPEIKIVGSSGPYPDGKEFDYGWQEMRRLKADLVDEHYYRPPEWFLAQADRYDSYDPQGPKVFAGEYACHTQSRKNSFEAALSEAAFMTGLERNAAVVHMTAYAPLFAHYDNWQWRPDLIWFDNLNVVRTPSWYVQQLYSTLDGTHVLTTTSLGKPLTGQNGLYASSVTDEKTGDIILKIANTSSETRKVNYLIRGGAKGPLTADRYLLTSSGKEDENTPEEPFRVAPRKEQVNLAGAEFTLSLEPASFQVFVIHQK